MTKLNGILIFPCCLPNSTTYPWIPSMLLDNGIITTHKEVSCQLKFSALFSLTKVTSIYRTEPWFIVFIILINRRLNGNRKYFAYGPMDMMDLNVTLSFIIVTSHKNFIIVNPTVLYWEQFWTTIIIEVPVSSFHTAPPVPTPSRTYLTKPPQQCENVLNMGLHIQVRLII